jgi:hypothetical protein
MPNLPFLFGLPAVKAHTDAGRRHEARGYRVLLSQNSTTQARGERREAIGFLSSVQRSKCRGGVYPRPLSFRPCGFASGFVKTASDRQDRPQGEILGLSKLQ